MLPFAPRWLGFSGLLLAAMAPAGSARADDCSFATANVRAYEQRCQGIDGCANLARMQAVVRSECGGTATSPPARSTPRSPVSNPPPARLPEGIEARLSRSDVVALQRALALLGLDPGGADGRLGPKTRQAIADFQKMAGLEQTGEVDEQTLAKLLERAAQANEPSAPDAAPSSACNALADLRGIDFQAEWRAAVGRLAALRELHADLAQIRNGLRSDLFYAGQWREVTATLLMTAKTTGDLIVNLAAFAPGAEQAAGASRAVEKWGSRFVDLVKGGQHVRDILRGAFDDLANDVLTEVWARQSTAGKTWAVIHDGIEDLSETAEIPENFQAIRDTLSTQIDRLDGQIAGVEARIAAATEWQQLRQAMLSAAERACSEKHGSQPPVPNRMP
jgi:peptidoglycan hydrolase-like protein with peptidoglycan-binding domain